MDDVFIHTVAVSVNAPCHNASCVVVKIDNSTVRNTSEPGLEQLSISYNYSVKILHTVQPGAYYALALTQVIYNGNFTKTLQNIALAEDIVSLVNATSYSIQTSNTFIIDC